MRPASRSLDRAIPLREFELLLAFARTNVSGPPARPPPTDLDWDTLVRAADAHGLIGPLWKWSAKVTMSEAVRAEIARRGRARTIRSLFLAAQLPLVLRMLERAGVDVLALKGPVLSALLYGSVAARPFVDLDLLVRRSQTRLAIDALLEEGFERGQTPFDDAYLLDHSNEITLLHRERGVTIDLHWEPVHALFRVGLTAEASFTASRSIEVGGVRVRTLGPVATILHTAIHAAGDGWNRLGRLCDFVLSTRGVEPAELAAAARAHRCELAVALALALAHDLLHVATPPVEGLTAVDRTRVALARRLAVRGMRRPSDPNLWEMHALRLAVAPEPGGLLTETLFAARPQDLAFFRLPDALAPAAGPLRPLRLALLYASGRRDRAT